MPGTAAATVRHGLRGAGPCPRQLRSAPTTKPKRRAHFFNRRERPASVDWGALDAQFPVTASSWHLPLRGLPTLQIPTLYNNGDMLDELLASAYEAAQHSTPDVRVAALCRIARVQTAFDRGHARRTFVQALDEIRRIPGRDGEFFWSMPASSPRL